MKTALITGSSRGIGRAIAGRLARDGYAVCINYIERSDMAEELVMELRGEGHTAMCFCADVADRGQVDGMIAAIHEQLGGIDLLVNNAGIAGQMQFQDIKKEQYDRMLAVNLGGCFNVTQAALPDMLKRHGGCIINVSSIWGSHGASCETVYSATKHGIIGFTRSLAAELAPTGIRVNCCAPGVIDTDMVRQLGQETLDMLPGEIPLGRLGTPDDVAGCVSWLAGAGYVTGQVVGVDGGFII